MVTEYIPDAGDVVRLAVRRSVLVVSSRDYNARAELMLCCPIVQARGYPFEVPMGSNSASNSAIVVDQLNSIDWLARKAEYQSRVGSATLNDVRTLLNVLLAIH